MENNRCFERGCLLNVEYECPCSSLPVYTCKIHILNHMTTPNKDHEVKLIFLESCEKTREAILLTKCDSNIIGDFNNKYKEEEKIQRSFRNIIVEQNNEVEKFEKLEDSRNSELEKELKIACRACESDSSIPKISVKQAYQDILSTYQQKPSLYNIVEKDNQTNLLIYNTEIESQASIILETSQPISQGTCIAQLPNGKLFCFGNYKSGIALLIDENYKVQELPSGTACGRSSAVYFNNYVYCFGGWFNFNYLTISIRFDLDRNKWNELTPLPKADSSCNSIIFNGYILISGYFDSNLLRYSVESNSFSTIPYDFAGMKRKILINAERLYLIECGYDGSIYESEIGSDTAWRKITNQSTIDFWPTQTYRQYNKEEIYIGSINDKKFCCFKFNLNEKRLIKLA